MTPSDSFHDEDAFGPTDDITWEPQPVCWPASTGPTPSPCGTHWTPGPGGASAATAWTPHHPSLLVPPRGPGRRAQRPTNRLAGRALPNRPRQRPAGMARPVRRGPPTPTGLGARSGCRPEEHRAQNSPTWVNEADVQFLTHVMHDGDRRVSPQAQTQTQTQGWDGD